MGKVFAVLYGLVNHVVFLGVFLYIICFLGNSGSLVPKTVDSGTPGPVGTALLVNIFLWVLFGVQHTLMARPRFKQWWTGIVPKHLERSTYVLISNLLMILILWQWQPMTGVVWEVQSPLGKNVLWALFFLGFGLVVLSSLILDHFDLLGTRQVILYAMGRPYTATPLKVVGFYKFVRHPLLLGWMIGFWSTPRMTTGHLVFAITTTAYILLAIHYEEKDLATVHGEPYRNYRERVSMIIPFLDRR